MFTFSHAGKIGDVLFSLYFCKEAMQLFNEKKFNFHLQTNVLEKDGVDFGLTAKSVMSLLPLLKQLPYINKITAGDSLPQNSLNLSEIRKLDINTMSADIRSWYYNLVSNHLPREFWKPIIQVEPNYKFIDKIIFTFTPRYLNYFIDFNCLKQFKNNLIFFGLESEYELFQKRYFKLDYFKNNNLLEIAYYIAGAKGVLGVPGGIYSLAECMKVPRILISPQWFLGENGKDLTEGSVNVHPIGGWNENVSTNIKLITSIQDLLNYENCNISDSL